MNLALRLEPGGPLTSPARSRRHKLAIRPWRTILRGDFRRTPVPSFDIRHALFVASLAAAAATPLPSFATDRGAPDAGIGAPVRIAQWHGGRDTRSSVLQPAPLAEREWFRHENGYSMPLQSRPGVGSWSPSDDWGRGHRGDRDPSYWRGDDGHRRDGRNDWGRPDRHDRNGHAHGRDDNDWHHRDADDRDWRDRGDYDDDRDHVWRDGFGDRDRADRSRAPDRHDSRDHGDRRDGIGGADFDGTAGDPSGSDRGRMLDARRRMFDARRQQFGD
ncbi:hypothetical protein NPA31_005770 [Aurantimonas sp. MSK8Z-1]|uniref:hypothetical protein n=1 Tax=Mangrovibrevibacter kandeliae TaxID=2968473 RepID=UPI0021198F84|nr:hypothetical protein [Aurantimonas sp. MSK8Z-1]MCW4114470.1 hypothetical protein [Aurantimonas sp. MSK8Z-1]